MGIHLRFALTLSFLSLLSIPVLAAIPPTSSLGIPPQDESYYKSDVIKCKDGSKKFTREQLNDDFCDCPDGTDEPGTSACPEGKFYCRNAGHLPLTIFSSRVNDGVCDCCDGSDEYDGTVNCPNTCWEAGKAAREKLKKKIETYKGGATIRKQLVEKAKQAFAKDEGDLSKLKSEETILKEIVKQLKDHKERIEKAEEEERLRKEKEEKRLRESEEKTKEQESEAPHESTDQVHEESPKQDARKEGHDVSVEAENDHSAEIDLSSNHAAEQHVVEYLDDAVESETADHSSSDEASSSLVSDQNVVENEDDTPLKAGTGDDAGGSKDSVSIHVEQKEQEGSDDILGLSKEELGRLVASRWTGPAATQEANEAGSTVEDEHQDTPNSAKEEEDNSGYTSEIEDDRQKYDDDDFEDASDEDYVEDHVDSDGSYVADEDDKIDYSGSFDSSDLGDSSSPSWLEKIQNMVQNVLQTFNFYKTPMDISGADRVRKEYDDSKSKLSKIQSRISSLTAKLKHDFGKEKEFYSFYDDCFETKQNKYVYKVCPFKQASQVEGHHTTGLGNWEKFEDSYRVMEFSNGDKCWNGPARSLKVRLRCGLTNELIDVDEPGRCEYVAVLSTPTVCLEERLKELQQKLEQMSTRQPKSHDEL